MPRLARLAAASLIGVAAVAVVPSGSASAAACAQGTGVSVVVGTDVRCDAGGAGSVAASNFTGVGHSLTYVTTQPGFVCQVDGAPSSTDCSRTPPASAYWALWWSDGTSGSWTYSTRGVSSLKVPAGGFVAFVFGNGKTAPGVSPVAAAAPSPKPTTPATKATKKPSTPRTTRPTAQATAAPSATKATKATKKPSASAPTSSASDTPTEDESSATPSPVEPSATPTDAGGAGTAADDVERASDESSGSDGSAGTLWAGLAVGVALLAGMGGIAWRRRAEGGRGS